MEQTNQTAGPMVGWMSSPNGRGTMDIVWSCVITAFLCAWSLICINVGGPTNSSWMTILRKLWICVLCITGPEFVLVLAIGQWQSAHRSQKDLSQLGSGMDKWTLKHGFFADMGGFYIQLNDMPAFPINSLQLKYLILEDWIDKRQIKEEVLVSVEYIQDKNKVDRGVRMITVVQTVCFVINLIARAIQNLPITTIELTACGFVVTTYATVYFWRHKPTDISLPIILPIDASSTQIRDRFDGKMDEVWYRTPLEFLDEPQYWIALCWNYFSNILWAILNIQWHHYRPIHRIRDDNFLRVPGDWTHSGLVMLFTTAFVAINISAWNFNFATDVERDLWRASSLVLCSTVFCASSYYEWFIYFIPSRARVYRWVCALPGFETTQGRWGFNHLEQLGQALRNNTRDKDPWYDVELRVILPGLIFAFLYSIARAYMLLEDIIGLRSMPVGAFESVDWVQFLPHF